MKIAQVLFQYTVQIFIFNSTQTVNQCVITMSETWKD